MRITVILLAAAIVATVATAGSRLSERTRAARLEGETGEGARPRLPAAGALKGLDGDYAEMVRRAGRALGRAAAGLSPRRGRGAGAP